MGREPRRFAARLIVHNRDYEGADADPENRARADVLSTAEGVRAALVRLGHPVELLGIGGDLTA